MRVALAGLGGAAFGGHLPALLRLQEDRLITLVAAADPDVARRDAAARALRHLPLFASAEEMLASTASDVLVIAAGPDSHAQLVALGASNRQHVVCEKPLTLTNAQHQMIADSIASQAGLGLVPVHQYRYSPAWRFLCRWGRLADRLGLPFLFDADVHRNGSDRTAATAWRADAATSGGMLADHGVHFLALGWTISREIEPIAVERYPEGDGERAAAHLRLGSGQMRVRLSSTSSGRSTRLDLRHSGVSLSWHDSNAAVFLKGHTLGRRPTAAISDRRHVNTLYASFYRDLVTKLTEPRWRIHRTAEALTVNRALVSLLERDSR
ncbi:MAG: Gfo/Idh/MocA family protein [Solirubrobacterales bacterium]